MIHSEGTWELSTAMIGERKTKDIGCHDVICVSVTRCESVYGKQLQGDISWAASDHLMTL